MTDQVKNTFVLLPPLKRAQLFQKHLTEDHISKSAIAKKYGKSLPYVSNTMRLLTLPPLVQEGLESEMLTEGHARALLTASDPNLMIRIYKKILIEKISVRETERLARG